MLKFESSGETKSLNSLDGSMFGEDERNDIDVPFYEFETVVEATKNFSDSNKLGKGGFGHVYKVNALNLSNV